MRIHNTAQKYNKVLYNLVFTTRKRNIKKIADDQKEKKFH